MKPTPETIIGWASKTAAETVAKTAVGGARIGEPTPVGGRPRSIAKPVQLSASVEVWQRDNLDRFAASQKLTRSAALRLVLGNL